MSPEDANGIYGELRKLLHQNGFDWVNRNADVELQIGTAQAESFPRYQEDLEEDNSEPTRRARRETVIGMHLHTEQERLTVLLDEIDRCIILPLRIAESLPRRLSTSSEPIVGIEIGDDDPGASLFRISSTEPDVGEHVVDLSDAVREIRGRL
jgi:hypothetical protein